MAGSVNKVILVGNLGKDPEVRSTQDGSKIVNLTLATSETWNDRASGERKERTEWHRVVAFGELADTCRQSLAKGRQVYVEGRLTTRQFEAKDGSGKRSRTEIVALQMRMERAAQAALSARIKRRLRKWTFTELSLRR